MEHFHTSFRALGSPCELQLYAEPREVAERAAELARAELARIEAKYSRYREDSVVSRINRSAGSGESIAVDPETAALLDYAATAFRESGGQFDITSGILRRAWRFDTPELPSRENLTALCRLVGFERVRWQHSKISLPDAGMELDFGGFGKEYAADRVAALCRGAGVRHGLVDLGGDLCVIGPHPDGQPWQIAIRDPAEPRRAMATLALSHGAIATSGDYERSIVVDDQRYSHLLDPRTGWPIRGLAAVSVVAEQCLVAGTGSTVAMLKGSGGTRWLASLGLPHLFVTSDGERGGSLWPREPEPRSHRLTQAAPAG